MNWGRGVKVNPLNEDLMAVGSDCCLVVHSRCNVDES